MHRSVKPIAFEETREQGKRLRPFSEVQIFAGDSFCLICPTIDETMSGANQ
jgi:hypothetical protein